MFLELFDILKRSWTVEAIMKSVFWKFDLVYGVTDIQLQQRSRLDFFEDESTLYLSKNVDKQVWKLGLYYFIRRAAQSLSLTFL